MYLKKVAILIFFFSGISYAQSLDKLGEIKPVIFTGGISINSIFYNGNANRDPFTYFLNGNSSIIFYNLINIPFSFSYTNQKLTFNDPSFKINRLSIHPSYKWITTHIGDISMSFSPYTLNGYQFTGLGFDLSPNGPFRISAMYGRLVREREYIMEEPEINPSYKRMGYGTKIVFNKPTYVMGLTIFKAKDKLNSINNIFPEETGIKPKENLVVSIDGNVKIFDKVDFHLEYANSFFTNDLNTDLRESSNLISSIFSKRVATSTHNAFNVDLSYIVGKGSLGIGYERIDPEYQTLGAYYFNNDLENITIKLNQSLFKNKLNINIKTGLQNDDLDNQKQSKLNRVVTAINLNLRASDKTTLNGSYSNFRTHTNIKDQFDYINEVRPYDNLDTLNFTQISHNANFNINYALTRRKENRQSINLNMSYQKTVEDQESFLIEINNNESQFFNSNISYNIKFSEKNLSIIGAFHSSFNSLYSNKTTTLGPTITIAKHFFNKKMRTTFSSSYNTSSTDGIKQWNVLNFRLNGTYRYKENHNLNLNMIQLFRNYSNRNNINDLTVILGYNYRFGNQNKKGKTTSKVHENAQNDTVLHKFIKINYKGYHFDGTISEITKQLEILYKNKELIYFDDTIHKLLEKEFFKIKTSENKGINIYKENVSNFLDIIVNINTSLESYKKEISRIFRDLTSDILQAHKDLEHNYTEAYAELNEMTERDENYSVIKKNYEAAKQLFIYHSWIIKQLQNPEDEVLKELNIYKGSMHSEVNEMKAQGVENDQIAEQIKLALIAYYDEQATLYATENDIVILNIE